MVGVSLASSQLIRDTFESRVQPRPRHGQRARAGRQQLDLGTSASASPAVGVDFSGCVTDPDTGLCCVDKVTMTLDNISIIY